MGHFVLQVVNLLLLLLDDSALGAQLLDILFDLEVQVRVDANLRLKGVLQVFHSGEKMGRGLEKAVSGPYKRCVFRSQAPSRHSTAALHFKGSRALQCTSRVQRGP